MAAPSSTMIGIRTGGVLSGDTDVKNMKERIINLINKLKDEGEFMCTIDARNLNHCMSNELHGPKGSYVVIAGVFNYWNYDSTTEFGKALSKEFGVEVMVMTLEEQNGIAQCDVFLDGENMHAIHENPASEVFRRMM